MDEPHETVEVVLSGATRARLGTATGTGTITDDDAAPTVTLALSPASIAESGASNKSTVTASLDRASSQATTVSATAGTHAVSGDFALSANKMLTIAAGATASMGTVEITAQDNVQDEPDKTVRVTGTATNSQGIGQPAAVPLTITDDGAPALAIDAPSVAEGDSGSTAPTFTVTLTPASGQEVTVNYAEGPDGTATAGTDYTALAGGTLTFAAGATSRTLTVAVTGDTVDEPHETVEVVLSEATNAAIGMATGTGTISDDDDAPTGTLAAAPASIAENGGTATVTATLSHASSAETTVTVTAGAGLYTVGSDATIVIAAGSMTDVADMATITAVDDAIDNVTVRRGTVTANLSGASSAAVTLAVTAAAGTHAQAGDFRLSSAWTLTLAAGATHGRGRTRR